MCLGLVTLACAGCASLVHRPEPRLVGPQTPPHYGQMVPTEKDKSTLPTYTVEPPDILVIDAVRVVPKPPYRIQATDILGIEVDALASGLGPAEPKSYLVDAAGARISTGKARTAALFKKPTAAFEELIRGGRTPMIALEDFTPLQGGVPIEVNGTVVGAIGVSGAANQQRDEDVAKAGAAAVR